MLDIAGTMQDAHHYDLGIYDKIKQDIAVERESVQIFGQVRTAFADAG